MNAVRRITSTLAVGAGVGAVAGAARRFTQRSPRSDAGHHRAPSPSAGWQQVTIDRSPEDIAPGGSYPAPLAALGDQIELRMQPAPGDRGTELGARLRTSPGGSVSRVLGSDPRQQVRSALRQAKELVEAGEVLSVDGQPEGHRPSTPFGALLDLVRRRSDREGLL